MGEFNQAKYIQQFQKENYDRYIFNVPKGKKKEIIEHYKRKGYESLNQYVNTLIYQDMTGGGVLKRVIKRLRARPVGANFAAGASKCEIPFGRLRGYPPKYPPLRTGFRLMQPLIRPRADFSCGPLR